MIKKNEHHALKLEFHSILLDYLFIIQAIFFLPSTNLSTLYSITISLQHTCDIKQFIAEVNVQFQVSKNGTVATIKTSLATSAQFGQFYAK